VASEALGKLYQDGEVILKQGAPGGRMYVVQAGQVEVVRQAGGTEVRLALAGPGEFVGEMEIFDQEPCAATVRALGQARILTIDKKTLLRQITEDPGLAFHLIQHMAARMRKMDETIGRLESEAEQALSPRGTLAPSQFVQQAGQRAWYPPTGRRLMFSSEGLLAAQAARSGESPESEVPP
jgi:CRP-like cAMP-binding protein